MPLPLNPTNNQTAVVNGILYTYNSTKGSWTVSTNSEVTPVTRGTRYSLVSWVTGKPFK